MSPEDRKHLDAVHASTQALTRSAETLTKAVSALAESQKSTSAMLSVTATILAAAVAEAVDYDRERLDRFLATTTGVIEAQNLAEEHRKVVLGYTDIIVQGAEVFIRRP